MLYPGAKMKFVSIVNRGRTESGGYKYAFLHVSGAEQRKEGIDGVDDADDVCLELKKGR